MQIDNNDNLTRHFILIIFLIYQKRNLNLHIYYRYYLYKIYFLYSKNRQMTKKKNRN